MFITRQIYPTSVLFSFNVISTSVSVCTMVECWGSVAYILCNIIKNSLSKWHVLVIVTINVEIKNQIYRGFSIVVSIMLLHNVLVWYLLICPGKFVLVCTNIAVLAAINDCTLSLSQQVWNSWKQKRLADFFTESGELWAAKYKSNMANGLKALV